MQYVIPALIICKLKHLWKTAAHSGHSANLCGFYDQIQSLPLLAAGQEHNSSVVEQASRDGGLCRLGVPVLLCPLLCSHLSVQVEAVFVCLQGTCAADIIKIGMSKLDAGCLSRFLPHVLFAQAPSTAETAELVLITTLTQGI